MNYYIGTHTVYGPWGCRYVVSLETLAVNLAQWAYLISGDDDEPDFDAALSVVTGKSDSPVDNRPGDGSIYGFWLEQFRNLKPPQIEMVKQRAQELAATTNVYEQFDGQE